MFKPWALAILGSFLALQPLTVVANPLTAEDERWHDMGNAALHPQTASNSFEWFYFDVQHKGGAQLAVTFLGPNPFDLTLADIQSGSGTTGHVGVMAQAYIPKVGSVQCFDSLVDATKLSYSENPDGSRWNLNIDGSELEMRNAGNGLRNYEIKLNMTCRYQGQVIGSVTGQLHYQGRLPGWKHQDGKLFVSGTGLYNSWVVAQPLAVVTGQYTFNLLDATGKMNSVSQTVDHDFGYHDHNQGNIPLTVANESWYWGRATTDSGKVAIYAYMSGKNQPDFPGDVYVPTPPSAILYMNDGNRVAVDSMEVGFTITGQEFEYKDPAVGVDMLIPQQYELFANRSPYTFQVSLPQTTTAAIPYYIRQASTMKITDGFGRTESAQVVNEQIEFKTFFRSIGLPVYP